MGSQAHIRNLYSPLNVTICMFVVETINVIVLNIDIVLNKLEIGY